jgi:hypothetical protein
MSIFLHSAHLTLTAVHGFTAQTTLPSGLECTTCDGFTNVKKINKKKPSQKKFNECNGTYFFSNCANECKTHGELGFLQMRSILDGFDYCILNLICNICSDCSPITLKQQCSCQWTYSLFKTVQEIHNVKFQIPNLIPKRSSNTPFRKSQIYCQAFLVSNFLVPLSIWEIEQHIFVNDIHGFNQPFLISVQSTV